MSDKKQRRVKVKDLFDEALIGQSVLAKGWVRTKRANKNVVFINLNDGSCLNNIQVVANPEAIDNETLSRVTTGASISVSGKLIASQGAGSPVVAPFNSRWAIR